MSPVEPALVNRDHPAVKAAALAFRKGFGSYPVFLRSGGSIPVVHRFQKVLGIPAVLMGFGLPNDHIHASNEKFSFANFLSRDRNLHLVSEHILGHSEN